MNKKIVVLVALFLVIGAIPGWCICGAVDSWISDKASSKNYPVKVGGMFLRGIHSIIESPVEIGYHTYDATKNRPEYGLGFVKGLGTGLLWAGDRALRGAWDIVTALLPDYNGEPGTHDLDAEIHGGGKKA